MSFKAWTGGDWASRVRSVESKATAKATAAGLKPGATTANPSALFNWASLSAALGCGCWWLGRNFGGCESGGIGPGDCRRKNGAHVALLEGAYAVAQGGRAFEFEIFGGGAHLGFELDDGLLQFVFGGDFADDGVFGGDGPVVGFDDAGELPINGANDGLRSDVVLAVVGFLLGAAAICFTDGLAHGVCHAIGVKNGAAFEVPRAAAHGLDQGGGAAEVAFF